MKLIADSGSTKTHWVLLNGSEETHCSTVGLNPLLVDEPFFLKEVESACRMLPCEAERVGEVFFYGAGCGTENACQRVDEWLGRYFRFARCEVHGDMLGACRAVCGSGVGMVGILGTGSNMCYYNGSVIAKQRVSTGFILGDEGSGNNIGKRLLKDYLEERMPQELRIMFHDTYPFSTAEFLDRIYRQPYANRFLASLVSFASLHRDEVYIKEVLKDCFSAFFKQVGYFGEEGCLPLRLVGGIVASFGDELAEAAMSCGVELGEMTASPIAGLIRFHMS